MKEFIFSKILNILVLEEQCKNKENEFIWWSKIKKIDILYLHSNFVEEQFIFILRVKEKMTKIEKIMRVLFAVLLLLLLLYYIILYYKVLFKTSKDVLSVLKVQ